MNRPALGLVPKYMQLTTDIPCFVKESHIRSVHVVQPFKICNRWNGSTGQWTYEIYNAAVGYVPPRQHQMPMFLNPAAAAGFPYSGYAGAQQQQLWLVPGGGLGPVVVLSTQP